MKRLRISDMSPTGSQLMPELLEGRKITGGGVYVFEPGEIAHPDEHIHDVEEVFIFVQGSGILPIDGTDHPIKTGDVIIVEAGEDHHTTSSTDDPLVAVWYLMDR